MKTEAQLIQLYGKDAGQLIYLMQQTAAMEPERIELQYPSYLQ